MNNKSCDLIIDVPYLWLHDGYGQTAPLIITAIKEVCEEHNLTWNVIRCMVGAHQTTDLSLTSDIVSHFVTKKDIPASKVLLRYNYPSEEKYKSDKLVLYTMFETDAIPTGWVNILNAADLVIVPNPYLQEIFQMGLNTKVELLYLPLHKEYYKDYTEEELLNKLPETFTFGFVGTPNFSTDRKGIIQLTKFFGTRYKDKDAVLAVKSVGFKNDNKNVHIITSGKSVNDVLNFYLSTHAGVYFSRGEGYGLPQIESSLLGRPVVCAYNSAAIWSSIYMPWVYCIPCEFRPAQYSHKSIANPGNWGYCDIELFFESMDSLYTQWKDYPEDYKQSIIRSHQENKLRQKLSHQKIKNQIEEILLPLL